MYTVKSQSSFDTSVTEHGTFASLQEALTQAYSSFEYGMTMWVEHNGAKVMGPLEIERGFRNKYAAA